MLVKEKEEVVQDKEVFLYILYAILLELSKLTTLALILLKEIDNLERVLKTLQSPMKTTLFLSLAYYKTIWQNREKNIQYWKEIIAKFIKQKHNSDTGYWGFPIEMYLGGLPHGLFFIALNL